MNFRQKKAGPEFEDPTHSGLSLSPATSTNLTLACKCIKAPIMIICYLI